MRMTRLVVLCAVLILALLPCIAAAQSVSPPLQLPAGAFGVGYRVLENPDAGRSFDYGVGDPAAPRAVPVHLWYPADSGDRAPMAFRDYVLAAAFADTTDAAIVESYLAAPVRHGADRELLLRFLDRPVRARRDAPPLPGPFPLVVYAPSINADPFENAVLFERLAGLGFVVASAPSWGLTEPEVSRDRKGAEAQRDDLRRVLDRAYALPFVDGGRLGVMGFSWGGMNALLLALEHRGVDALVLMDGAMTMADYRPVAESFSCWDPRALRAPLLEVVLADEARLTDFHEAALYADRILWRVPGLLHRDLSADGVVRYRLASASGDDGLAAAVWGEFADVVTRFLQEKLQPDAPSGRLPLAEDPAPAVGKWAVREALPAPPTPPEIAAMVERDGAAAVAALVRELRGRDPGLVPFEEDRLLRFAWQWGPDRLDDLEVLLDLNLEVFPESAETLFWKAQVALEREDRDGAVALLRRALEKEPGHGRSRRLLERVTGEAGPADD